MMTTLDSQVVKVFSKWLNSKVGQDCFREGGGILYLGSGHRQTILFQKYTILLLALNQISKRHVALLQQSQLLMQMYVSD